MCWEEEEGLGCQHMGVCVPVCAHARAILWWEFTYSLPCYCLTILRWPYTHAYALNGVFVFTSPNLDLTSSIPLCTCRMSPKVFVQVNVSVQYQVQKDKIYDAYYRLSNPSQQIKAYVSVNNASKLAPNILLATCLPSV